MVDFLFLDFDGVLHPPYDGLPTPKEVCFCHLPRFEAVMRQHPGVHIVISSTWRQQFGLAQLRGYFCADIAQRIVGVTPKYPAEGPPRLHVREWEILQWLQTHQASHLLRCSKSTETRHNPADARVCIGIPRQPVACR